MSGLLRRCAFRPLAVRPVLSAAVLGAGLLLGLAGDVHAQNSPPTVAKAIPDLFAEAGSVFIYSLPAGTFTDSDDDSLTYNAVLKDGSALPEWLDFNLTHTILEGIPGDGNAGTLTIRVTADDGNGGTVSDEFDLTVAASAPKAVLSLAGPASALEGDSGTRSLKYTVRLSDPPSENVFFKICFGPKDIRVRLNAERDASGGSAWQAGADYRLAGTAKACTGNHRFPRQTENLSRTFMVETRGDTDVERDEAFTATLELTVPTQGAVLGRNRHTHWILNDDYGDARLVIEPSSLTLAEGQSATFTVKLSEQPSGSGFQSKEVRVAVPSLLADFNKQEGKAYFPSKENPVLAISPLEKTFTPTNYGTPQTFRIFALRSDASADSTHNLRMQGTQKLFAGPDRNYKDVAAGISVTITRASSPETRPEVSIAPAVEYASETGDRPARFTVSRTGPTASHLAVNLFVSERTDGGQVFLRHAEKGLRQLLIPAGQSSATYIAPIWSDRADEPNGEVRVSIRASGAYGIDGTAGKASVPVLDDDGPRDQIVSIEAVESPVTEGGGAVFRIRRTGDAPAGSLAVLLAVGEDASGGQDFVAAGQEGDRTFTIPAGDRTGTYTVPTVADGTDEPDGEVRVSIRASGAYGIDQDRGAATVAVQDDDDPPASAPVASFESAASSADEAAGTRRDVTVSLSPVPQSPFTLYYAVGGTATEGGDFYIDGTSGSLAVAANAATAVIRAVIRGDTADEQDETVVLTLSEGSGYTLGSGTVHTLTIEDDDEPRAQDQIVRISAAAGSVTEGSDAEFELVRTGLATSALTVGLSVTETSAGGGDFVASGDEGNQEAVFPAGSSSVTWRVPTVGDGADEPDGGVRVTVRNGTGYTRNSSRHSADAVIADDDATEVRLSGSADDIAENGGTKVLTVSTGRALVGDESLTVPLVFSDGARRGTDYTLGCAAADNVTCLRLAGTGNRPGIRFDGPEAAGTEAAGTTARSVTLTLTAVDDGIDEGLGERVSAGLGTLDKDSGENLGGGATGIGYVAFRIDDDDTTSLSVSPMLSGAEFWEGDTLDVTVSGIPADFAAVTLAAPGSTAVRGTDYRLLRTGGAVLGANDTLAPSGGSVSFKVRALSDSAAEGAETVSLWLDDPGGSLDTALGTLTLHDGARPATGATVSKGSLVLVEGGSSGSYAVALTRSPKAGQTVTVTATSADAEVVRVAGPDGTQGVSAALAFTAADWNMPKTVTVHAQDDTDGTDETVNISHAVSGPGAWQGAPASPVRVTVDDDEGMAPRVSIEAGSAITEGSFARFTLRVNPAASPHELGVRVQVTQDGAYVNPNQGQLGMRFVRFRPGASTANLWVRTEDDRMGEAAGAVKARVVLASSGYRLASPNRAQVAVNDNDGGAVTLSVADARANERDGFMNFTATLSRAVDYPVLFRVRTRETNPVSATAGDDYRSDFRPLDKEIRIWPGRTSASFWVRIFDDTHNDGGERFEVVLSEVRGATVGDGVAVGTITNDDPMPGALLARFGRTVAEQSLDAVSRRLSASREASAESPLASSGAPESDGIAVAGAVPGHSRFDPSGAADPHALDGTDEDGDWLRAWLTGPGFSAAGQQDALGGNWSFWGRASEGSFDGAARGDGTDVLLDGTATTGLVGADYARDGWLAGLALVHGSGDGKYSSVEAGEGEQAVGGTLETSLTALVPYASVQATEAIRAWGAAGRGTGDVSLETLGQGYRADMQWTMAALGLRGTLSGAGGLSLEWVSDALWARTSSDGVPGLAASESDISRLRLGLEGSRQVALGAGVLVPRLEIGLRRDGGDAETGSGVEAGGGLAWRDPRRGLELEVSGRTLLSHGDDDLGDRGFSASVSWDRDASGKRGLSLSLRQQAGGQSRGGLEALFAPTLLEDRKGAGMQRRSWQLEGAYGFPALGGRYVGSPHLGLGHSADVREWTAGWRLEPDSPGARDLSFGLKAVRRESEGAAPENVIGFEFALRW
ncbi:MAG: hypothetical protein F4090_02550 [Nitrospira sp. SB0672_bin_25]|nr:hypothetical protein [Nitrospira sp. SB0672_bin_25]